MSAISALNSMPYLPAELKRLRELAYNLRWSWDHDSIDLFRRLDPDLWEETGHNPVWMLETVGGRRLKEAARDESFLTHLERVSLEFDRYIGSETTWDEKVYGKSGGRSIAYFSAEFGLTDCLLLYAGGLGVLAGDYLKSASDLGLPLIGVGLLYQEGYFRQRLRDDGWQDELFPNNDFDHLPVLVERKPDGTPVTIEIAYPEGRVVAQVWRVQVGRIPLFLLDTNLPVNAPEARCITEQLYVGDAEARLRQEILLGIGGMQALDAMGMHPSICHMNEGHTAFAALERVRLLMHERELSFVEAMDAAMPHNVFTTHTSLQAGIDLFPPNLMDKYFHNYCPSLGLSWGEFLSLGRQDRQNGSEHFSMAILALRLSAHRRGVSRLHGQISRRMWQGLWPNLSQDEVPIASIANGIHINSWLSKEMRSLYDHFLGSRWIEKPTDQAVWERVDQIPDEELWQIRQGRRAALVAFARQRLRAQYARWGTPPVESADEVLDPEALTIGFARRFTTYKRATLLLRDPGRLAKILGDSERPAQVIYAGKAHPQDNEGKEMIRQIIQLTKSEKFRRRIVLIEDYDICIARHLVHGVDIWLNTPRRPMEASGTSGMKAAVNGALNVSTLDGWWDEAYQSDLGWAIGRGGLYDDHHYQDEVESIALYELLEKEIIPLFYDRKPNGLPQDWICRMKAAIRCICPVYNSDRMVRDYMDRVYVAAERCVSPGSEQGSGD